VRHRWSGWPGAWCLDCGVADPLETAIALADYDPFDQEWASDEARERYDLSPCHHPGERLCDPYHFFDVRDNGT
jgi:hypothetical protein